MAFVNDYLLNVDIKRRLANIVPTFAQGETSRLRFRIFDNNMSYDLSGFTRAEIKHKLPSGETYTAQATLNADKEIVYDYPTKIELGEVGTVEVILSIYSGASMVSIQPFKIFVYDSFKKEELSYISVLQELIGEAQHLEAETSNTITQVNQKLANRLFIGAFNLNTSYKMYNEVIYNGSTWRALKDVKGVAPVEGANWTLIARAGENGTGTVHVHHDKFTASAGQRVFKLTKTYDQFQNRTTVFVNFVSQRTPENYQETSADTITFYEGLSAGDIVEVKYFSTSVPLQSDIQTTVNNHTTLINNKMEIISYQKFTSTANQKDFTLSNPYVMGKNRLKVYIEGIVQLSPFNFTETTSTSFTLSEALPSGLEVIAEVIG